MATIYAYSSNSIYCTYSLTMTRSGSTITLKASGTIYGNGSSEDTNNSLYAHVLYNVSPANTSGTSTYVTSYGNRSPIGLGVKVVSAPLNKSSIPKSGKSFSASWSWDNNSAVTLSNCALFLSKSASDASALGVNAYAFIGKKSSSLSVNELRYYTLTLSVAAGYTNVSNPTSVSISPAIVKPSVSNGVKVSWSGASGGTNNAIKSYTVTFNGVTKTGVTGSSTTFDAPSSRGSSYSATVKAIPTISGYGPSSGKSGGSCTVNTLPNAPSVSASATTVASTGGTVKFTVTAGATNNSGLTATLYYATSSSGSKTKFTSPLSLTVSAKTTYYFYTYDGLEYGSAKTSTISMNTKPTVSSATMTYTDTTTSYYSLYSSLTYYVPTVNLSATFSKTGTYLWLVVHGGTAEDISTAQKPTSVSLKKYLKFGETYYCRVRVKDSYEWSSWANTASKTVPAKPAIKGIYNTSNSASNVSNSVAGHYYQNVNVHFTNGDSGIYISSVKLGSTDVSSGHWGTNSSGYRLYYYINNLNELGLTNKKSYTLSFIFAHRASSETISASYTITYWDSNAPVTSISLDKTTIKPLTTSGNLVVSLPSFNLADVDYGSANKVTITLDKGTTRLYGTAENFTVGADGTRAYNIPISNIVISSLARNTTHTVRANVSFKDVFGNTSAAVYKDFTIDLRESFKPNSTSLTMKLGNNPIGEDILKENDIITFSLAYGAYHGGSATMICLVNRSDTNDISGINNNNWKEVYRETLSLSGSTDVSSTWDCNYTIQEQTESKYIFFRTIVLFNNDTPSLTYTYTSSNNYVPTTQRLVAVSPLNFNIISFEGENLNWSHQYYNSGGGLRLSGADTKTINNYGGLVLVKFYILGYNDDTWKFLKTNGTLTTDRATEEEANNIYCITCTQSGEITIANEEISNVMRDDAVFSSDNFAGLRTMRVRLYVETTTSQGVIKATEGVEGIIYNMIPTISYRENLVGINYKLTASDISNQVTPAAIKISTASVDGIEKHYVVLQYELRAGTIDIKTGEIDGFVIDGGSWS